jgi:DNA polymerase I
VNWQNLPEGLKVVRRGIVPKHGDWVISTFDYSKIEPRLLAYFASKKGDDTLADYLRKGIDPYRAVVGPVYGKAHDELTDREYKDGKILFLSLIYGGGVRTIREQFGIDQRAAKSMIGQFHTAWPIVRFLQDDVVRVAKRRGHISTPWGRPLHLEEFGEHKLLNKLVQGSAAHMLKRSIIRVDEWLETAGLQSHLTLNVHDELDFDGPAAEVPILNEHVPALMVEELITPVVPILVDHEVSPRNWAEKFDYNEWRQDASGI